MNFLRVFFSTAPKTPPNRARVRMFEQLVTPLTIAACLLLLWTLPIYQPHTLLVVFIWSCLGLLYTIIFYFLKGRLAARSRLFSSQSVMLHSLVAILAIFALQVLIPNDDLNIKTPPIWILYLAPLTLVSRYGTTWQWIAAAILSSFFYLTDQILILPKYASASDLFQLSLITILELMFLACIAGIYHILVRQMRNENVHLVNARKMTNLLSSQPSFEAAYQMAAGIIQELHFPFVPYVFILMENRQAGKLKVVGAVGKSPEYWQTIELKRGEGITGTVYKTGKPINVQDVKDPKWREIYFLSKGFEDVVSEIAIPIIYQGETIGVLDVESPRTNEFDVRDQSILEGFAESLALSFGHFLSIDNNIRGVYQLALDTIEAGDEHKNFRGWFQDVAQSAGMFWGAKAIALIRLAPGTGYPLLPIAVWPLTVARRQLFTREQLEESSIIWTILAEWKLAYWGELNNWVGWKSPADHLLAGKLKSLGIKTLFFIPIGSIEEPDAALFVAFDSSQLLGDSQRLSFLAFSAALEKSLQAIIQHPAEARRTGAAVHQILVPSVTRIFSYISNINKIVEHSIHFDKAVEKLKWSVRLLRERVKKVTVTDRYDLRTTGLIDALNATANEFIELRPTELRITFDNVDLLEDEPFSMRKVYYDVIVEAISNGVEHGKANLVQVAIEREVSLVRIKITDDGRGMPETPDKNKPFGIFYIAKRLKSEMSARISFSQQSPHGTVVVLEMPVRPIRRSNAVN